MVDRVMVPCGHGRFDMHGQLAGCKGGSVVQVDIDAACMHMTSDQGWDWDDLDDDEKGRIRMIMSEYVSAALGQVIG